MGASGSSFGASSTAMQVVKGHNLAGRIYVVTGANTGIGKETVRALVSAGATVVIGCRSLERAEAAIADIRTETKCEDERLFNIPLDTSNISSVKAFAQSLEERGITEVNCLINNAGIMALPQFTTNNAGLELQWATNHLGHFALTQCLLPMLKAGAPSRVINVASVAHTMAPKPMTAADFPPREETYSDWSNYGISKFCNVLHAKELTRRYSADGITAMSVHPGVIKTELHRNNGGAKFFYNLGYLFTKSIGQGAATQTLCAVSEQVSAGAYYADCATKPPRADTEDEQLAIALWEKSKELTS